MRAVGVAAVIVFLHSQGYVRGSSGSSLALSRGWYYLLLDLSLGLVTAVSAHSLMLSRRRAGEGTLGEYIRKRIVRIWPLYAAALTLFVAVWFRHETVEWYLAQYLCLGMFFSGFVGEPVTTLWYAQLQIVYSLFAGVAFALGNSRTRRVVLAASVAALAAWCLVPGLGDERLVLYIPAYLVGFGVASDSRLTRYATPLFIAGIVAAAGVLSLAVGGERLVVLVLRAMVPALVYPFVMRIGSVFDSIGTGRWLRIIAQATFSAYLFHRLVLSGMRRIIQPTEPVIAFLVYSVVGLVLSFAVGWAVQASYDFVVRALSQRGRA